ncbi:RNA polymerase sigma factor RpoE [compost metagenome]
MTSAFKIDEKALLTQFQSGNKLAFDQIFRLYKPALTFFGNRILSNYSQIDSQDLVLDIFMKLYEKRASFESLQSIKAFLYISTKNTCLNAIEKEKVRLKRIENNYLGRKFDGLTTIYDDNGKLLTTVNYKDGIKHGEQRIFDNEECVEVNYYENDVIVKM